MRECFLCTKMISIGVGVVLVNCLHFSCTECLKKSLLRATTIRCPFPNNRYECEGFLNERVLETLLSPQEYCDLVDRQIEATKDEASMILLTDAGLAPNPESFDCPICSKTYEAYEGVLLLDCLHSFCRNCLSNSIKQAEDVIVRCPNKDNNNPCGNVILDRDIQCLLSVEDYNVYLDQSLGKVGNARDCKIRKRNGGCSIVDPGSSLECSTSNSVPIESTTSTSNTENQYQQLLELDKQALVHNIDESECILCSKMISIGKGVLLVNCLHSFCTKCLKNSLLEATTIGCPFPNGLHECEGNLVERELKALLSAQEYNDLMERQLEAIKNDMVQATRSATEVSEELDMLMTLTDASVVPNPEPFDCPVCFGPYDTYEGVILRECFHSFCRDCLINSIKHADDVIVQCPFTDDKNSCECLIQDREIKCLLSADEYNEYLGRSLRKAESLANNAFHCKTPDCIGWCLTENNVTSFWCPICFTDNCLKCKTIHANMSCKDYQDKLSRNDESGRSEQALENMVASGAAMRCPKCKIVLTKIAGCDFMTCSVCKTAVCWATRGPRWGPGGAGDTSGGCRCNVNGVKCHPSCMNCH
ncbi:ranBP-type and C3HC4-type zinc finger-containing protein 1-like isoform X2 [Ochlerotatus camptorhynchus]